MYNATTELKSSNSITWYQLKNNEHLLSFGEAIELWRTDQTFRDFYNRLLAESPYSAFRWETPVLTSETADDPFEFVLIDTPSFAIRRTDSYSFDQFFTSNDENEGVVCFKNLGGDATLIVPSPRGDHSHYGHLAAFVRNAPASQVDALWQTIGQTVKQKISNTPLWLSTAGGGVAWLHVRLDDRPKYYGYGPYANQS